MNNNPAVTVIVPVYGDLPSLKDCVASLKEHVSTDRHKIMLVNDCGPEADTIEEYLKDAIDSVPGFEYHRNPENLGFIGNCNRAVFELDRSGNDVLLLNSDTIVTKGFLEEIHEVLYLDEKFALASPRTNNATIATIPFAGWRTHGIDPQKSYQIFQNVHRRLPRYNVSPIAPGFCLMAKRVVIDQHGLFDPSLGAGYGEEDDLALRLRREGFSSVICNHAYVFHMESRSFNAGSKRGLLDEKNLLIAERYPEYAELLPAYVDSVYEQETAALEEVGISPAEIEKHPLKRLLKQNRWAYKWSKWVYQKIKR